MSEKTVNQKIEEVFGPKCDTYEDGCATCLVYELLEQERTKRDELVGEIKLQTQKELLNCVTAEGDNCYFLRVSKESSLFITQPNNPN